MHLFLFAIISIMITSNSAFPSISPIGFNGSDAYNYSEPLVNTNETFIETKNQINRTDVDLLSITLNDTSKNNTILVVIESEKSAVNATNETFPEMTQSLTSKTPAEVKTSGPTLAEAKTSGSQSLHLGESLPKMIQTLGSLESSVSVKRLDSIPISSVVTGVEQTPQSSTTKGPLVIRVRRQSNEEVSNGSARTTLKIILCVLFLSLLFISFILTVTLFRLKTIESDIQTKLKK